MAYSKKLKRDRTEDWSASGTVHGRLAIGLVCLGTACWLDPRTAESPHHESLERLETQLGQGPLRYRSYRRADRFRPLGAYREGDTLWFYSHAQPRQLGFRRAGSRWDPVGERTGPIGTEHCVASTIRTYCVGSQQRGGLRTFGADGFVPALPQRAGLIDVALTKAGEVLVLDSVEDQLLYLSSDGTQKGALPVPAASRRVGALGPRHVYVLSSTRPYLSVLRLDAPGVVFTSSRVAPWRTAHYDESRDQLWLAGPANHRLRRASGPIRHLEDHLVVLDARALRKGRRILRGHWNLSERGLVDVSAICTSNDRVIVVATGSDRALVLMGGREAWHERTVPAGGGAAGVLCDADGFAIAARLDDTVRWYANGTRGSRVLVLSPPTAPSLGELGERLFYGAYLWNQHPSQAFTCNSCHWGTGTDHRRHPGFLEQRWEITRPLDGIGAIRPVFTTGGAASLSVALEGLFRGLDARMWDGHGDAYWDYPIEVRHPLGVQTLSPRAARHALLTFLMELPVTPGPLRNAANPAIGAAAQRGWDRFRAHCASCHRPYPSQRAHARVEDDHVLSYLHERPLTFGSVAFAQAGPGPDFTPNGNRISPLLNLARGGPYFASGAARTLDDVLRGYDPTAARVHDRPPETGSLFFADKARQELEAFLLSL